MKMLIVYFNVSIDSAYINRSFSLSSRETSAARLACSMIMLARIEIGVVVVVLVVAL